MRIEHDPDRYYTGVTSRPCTRCDGDTRKCDGGCNGMTAYVLKERPWEEVKRIKAERARKEEDEILVRAEVIRRARRPTEE